MEIGNWLRSLGLGRYELAFRESAVDAEVMRDLTDSDLEKLGVLLGHRKRLLKAIIELPDTRQTIGRWRSISSYVDSVAERRQLTVMFCDLVGSTSLSARLVQKICAS